MADEIDIRSLKGAESMRMFPNVMLGSSTLDGVKHAVVEILGNSIDESGHGHGDQIDITLHEDYSVTVRDYGRGVPLDWNEREQAWNYALVFEQVFAGGKYDSKYGVLNSITDLKNFTYDDHPGIASVGQHGVGASATQQTSEWCIVKSIKDGICTEVRFKDGEHVGGPDPLKYETTEKNGTEISWKPDDRVFNNDTKIPQKWVRDLAFNTSIVAGVNVNFTGRDGSFENFKKQTIAEYLESILGDAAYGHAATKTVDSNGDTCIAEAQVALGPTNGSGLPNKFYQNYIAVSSTGGVHAENVDISISNFFTSIGSESGVRFKGEDFHGLITVIVSARANKPDYANQTKDYVQSGYIGQAIYDAVNLILAKEKAKNSQWLQEVVELAVQRAQLRVESEEIRKQTREIAKKIKSRGTLPSKFVSCENYDKKRYDDVELWIGEGASATGQLVQARSSKNQAIYPLRGKGLNLFKASTLKVISNAEVSDLIQILGCGVSLGAGLGDDFASFNLNNIRCNKVIFCSDADTDGFHIRMLGIVLIWKMFPELLRKGMVYIAETPLYAVGTGKNTEYFYSQEEFDSYRKRTGIQKFSRYKGLGEVNADVLHHTTMAPDTRRLIKVQFDPAEAEIYDVFEALFGTSTDSRKRAVMSSLLADGLSYDDFVQLNDSLETEAASVDVEDVLEYEEINY